MGGWVDAWMDRWMDRSIDDGWIRSRYPIDHIRENVANMLDVRTYLLDTYGMNNEMYKKADHTLRNLMRHFAQ